MVLQKCGLHARNLQSAKPSCQRRLASIVEMKPLNFRRNELKQQKQFPLGRGWPAGPGDVGQAPDLLCSAGSYMLLKSGYLPSQV
ncbi:MAG: hypothetical protein M1269_09605 [Chloroflexi bacterium]|nr:hypothetical protein [Chloroflexota bacterium]